MANSRLERIGTIFTRVTGLIRTGAMKLEERPLWYDVYKVFPPATTPRYDNPAPPGEIRKIFYPEDAVRARYYSKLKSAPAINLNENGRPSHCHIFLDNCKRIAADKGVTMDEAFDEAFASSQDALMGARNESSKLAKSPRFESKQVREESFPNKSSVNMESVLSNDDDTKPSTTQSKGSS